MANAIDPKGYIYLCMTQHGWGSSKTSQAAAIKACKDHMGHSHTTQAGYVVYKVHPEFEIDPVNGTIYTPKGHPPIKILDKIKRKERKAIRRMMQCPRCKKISYDTSTSTINCGDCLMDAVEIVELVQIKP